MVKQSSTNSSFFKTGGREAGSHEIKAQNRPAPKPDNSDSHGVKMQGKQGQPNFIPGEAAVGESAERETKAKK